MIAASELIEENERSSRGDGFRGATLTSRDRAPGRAGAGARPGGCRAPTPVAVGRVEQTQRDGDNVEEAEVSR
jgi:hypothetical protein